MAIASVALRIDKETPLVAVVRKSEGKYAELGRGSASLYFGATYSDHELTFSYGWETAEQITARIDHLAAALAELRERVVATLPEAVPA